MFGTSAAGRGYTWGWSGVEGGVDGDGGRVDGVGMGMGVSRLFTLLNSLGEDVDFLEQVRVSSVIVRARRLHEVHQDGVGQRL